MISLVIKKNSRNIIALLFTVLSSEVFCAPMDHFVTKWDTTKNGTSDSFSITIPTKGGGYNYAVDWDNDAQFDEFNITGSITHTFPTSGIHYIRIKGSFPQIYFNNSGDKEKILDVFQWGTSQWRSMEKAFYGAFNMTVYAQDIPDFSNVTSFKHMFRNASNIGNENGAGSYGFWDTSNVQNMSGMFSGATSFDMDLSGWNIESVTNLSNMFNGVTLSTEIYDALLVSWVSQTVNQNLIFDGGNSIYCSAQAQNAWQGLTTFNNWTITDGGICPNTEFISRWDTKKVGTTNNTSISIPTTGTGYSYAVDWTNDGVFDEFNITGDISHDYGAQGTYTVKIHGDFPRIYFNNTGDKNKIVSVEQWGIGEWTSMNSAFYGSANLVNNATDTPNLALVDDLSFMFYDATNLGNGNGTWLWNTQTILTMERMFNNASAFNKDIGSWNTSGVTSMAYMFNLADQFNQDISQWDTTNVLSMEFLFKNATNFNQNISTWDTSSVTNMKKMFKDALAFDQNIGTWNVESVDDFANMFNGVQLSTPNYDALLTGWSAQNLINGKAFNGGLSIYCSQAAQDARAFMISNKGWSISDGGLCNNAPVITSNAVVYIDENQTAVITVTATDIETPILLFSITSGADLSKFTINPTSGELVFLSAPDYEANNSAAGNNQYFVEATVTDDGVPSNSTSQLIEVNVNNIAESLPSDFFKTTWKTNNSGTSNSTSITIPTRSELTYAYQVDWNGDDDFNDTDESIIYTGNATHDYGIAGTYSIAIKGSFPTIHFGSSIDNNKILSVDQWGTNQWETMQTAFYNTINLVLKSQDLPDLSTCTNMAFMFSGSTLIGGSTDTGNWNWDTSNISTMSNLFGNASSFNKDISNWNTENNLSLNYTFLNAINFNQNIGTWNTSMTFDMSNMFKGASSFNQDLSVWNTSNVISMSGMFYSATSFDQSLASWNIEMVTDFSDMFNGMTLSTANYDAMLVAWDLQNLTATIIFHGGNAHYCSQVAQDARTHMISTDGWSIADNGLCVASTSDFVTTWKTDNPGNSSDTSITIPTIENGTNYDIDWNNDNIFDDIGVSGSITHDYGIAGTYTIRIRGNIKGIYINDSGDKEKIISIDQWGDINWTTMTDAFDGAKNLVLNATDTPDLTLVIDLSRMFKGATIIDNGSANWNWNTLNIEYMNYMFAETNFNQDINSWNTANVKSFSGMFSFDSVFNQPLNNWNTTSIQNLTKMFENASAFNQDISSWNFESSLSFYKMFSVAGISRINYDALLIALDAQNLNPNLTFYAGLSNYCSQGAQTARNNIIANDGWVFIDGEIESQSCYPHVDLDLTINANVSTVDSASLIDFTIVVSNNGPNDVIDALITDVIPNTISSTSWICNTTGTASCSASGTGMLNDTVSIPIGEGITYTVSASTISSYFKLIFYSVTIEPSTVQFDADFSNNFGLQIIYNNDYIFAHSFERQSLLKVFELKKTGSISYDFNKLVDFNLSLQPIAIIQGINETSQTNLWIHARKLKDSVQIRLSTYDQKNSNWSIGSWSDINISALKRIYW